MYQYFSKTLAQTLRLKRQSLPKSYQLGEEGVKAVLSEIKDNLVGLGVIEPLLPNQVTREVQTKALDYLMYLKQHHNDKVKGRGCANRRKQWIKAGVIFSHCVN